MRYHIVGIAGAGMSAIAQILLDQGHFVSGSDPQQNALTAALVERGATIHHEHTAHALGEAEALVITSAIQPNHVEVIAARERGIPILKRADLWAEWSQIRQTIAVAGTHGKTTTTAMIALALTRAGLEPGFLIGGESPDLGTNARWGKPEAPLVIEADEYDRTFLAIKPHVAIITNCEWDHVDIYASEAEYQAAFQQFGASVPQAKNLIVCADDPGVMQIINQPDASYYGIDETIAHNPASCRLAPLDWTAANLHSTPDNTQFELWRYDRKRMATRLVGPYALRVPGAHNIRNAIAAIAACNAIGAALEAVHAALAEYQGTLRRFEYKGQAAGITVIDDYAHHPTEVRATLAAARTRYPQQRIIAYLQPHTYSRTQALIHEWPDAFGDADSVLIGDIYAAREQDSLGMSAEGLAVTIGSKARAVGGIQQAALAITQIAEPNDIVIIMGAGTSQQVGPLVLSAIRQRAV